MRFFITYRQVIIDVIIFVAIAIVIFGAENNGRNFFLGLASGLTLIRLGDSIAAAKKRDKENEVRGSIEA